MRNFLLLVGFFLCSISLAQSQRTIRGTVSDSNGEPIIGASVLAVGSTVGTVTDFEGKYELTVPDGTTQIQVAYTGYETKIMDVGASNVMDVNLAEGILLESAVITALGISRDKRQIGYSVESLDG